MGGLGGAEQLEVPEVLGWLEGCVHTRLPGSCEGFKCSSKQPFKMNGTFLMNCSSFS